MKKSGAVLTTTVYHIKPGLDKKFVKIWNEYIATLAYEFGSDRAGLYHNGNTDEFISVSHWGSLEDCNSFLNSSEFQKQSEELSECCLIPLHRQTHEIFYERVI